MATIWVIEQGDYSDYRVVGVFSSRENAHCVADAINRIASGDQVTVTEWPLDPVVADLNAGHRPFFVVMGKDGTVERAEEQEISGFQIAEEVHIYRRSLAPIYQGKGVEDCLNAPVWAKDVEHAVKIANEHRIRLIASGEWNQVPA